MNKILTITTLAPVGRFMAKDKHIPIKKQITEMIAEANIRPLKLLTIFLAVIAGKIIRLEIKRVPIILIPKTTVKAVKKAITN